jgi:RNA polymerase sigma-70 factor (ECF subfamily)
LEQIHLGQDDIARLFDEHGARAFRYARAMGLSRADADDVVAESFLRVLRSREVFRGDAAFASWLFRIVRNQASDMARGESRRRDRQEAVAGQTLGSPGGPEGRKARPGSGPRRPDETAEGRETHAVIGEAIEALDPGQRAALSLVTAGELSYREAAEVEGTTSSAMAARVFRARQAVRKHLVEKGILEV